MMQAHLKDKINDNTVNKLLGINLIYFFNPLNLYLDEFFRILKPGGIRFFACKFDKIQGFDEVVAPKKSDFLVIAALAEAGFEATSDFVDLGDENSRYTAIEFHKPL